MTGIEIAAAAASVIGTAVSAGGAIMQGNAAAKSANYQAAMARRAADEQRAQGIQQANEERRKSKIVQSNAIAALANSGGSASDVTASNIISGIAGEGSYRAAVRNYDAELQAQNLENKANLTQFEGRIARKAGQINAAAEVFKGASSLYAKYSGADKTKT